MCGKVSLANKIETTGEITKPQCAGTCKKLCPAMRLFNVNAQQQQIAESKAILIDNVFGTHAVIQSGNPDSLSAFFKIGGWR